MTNNKKKKLSKNIIERERKTISFNEAIKEIIPVEWKKKTIDNKK